MSDDNNLNKVVENVLKDVIKEQKTSRRWGVFFKILTFTYLFFFIFLFYNNSNGVNFIGSNNKLHTAIIKIDGQIAYGSDWSSDNIISGLSDAFGNENVKGIILSINSPGGSPVQSDQVYNYIQKKKKETGKNVVAIINDLGASGAYYIASSSDFIYSNPMSLVGSIGVISGGFGFSGLMDKIGVDRRIYTSGENKSMLDPFSPENPEQIEKWKNVLKDTHEQFIIAVKNGRGNRLSNDPELFSGRIWSGNQALNIGLIDGFKTVNEINHDYFNDLDLIDYTKVKKVNISNLLKVSGENLTHGIINGIKNQWNN